MKKDKIYNKNKKQTLFSIIKIHYISKDILIWQLCHEKTATFDPPEKLYFLPTASSLPKISALPLVSWNKNI